MLRGMPRAFWILWTGALINRLGGFVMPLLALYLTGERGLRVEEAGFIVSLLGAGVSARDRRANFSLTTSAAGARSSSRWSRALWRCSISRSRGRRRTSRRQRFSSASSARCTGPRSPPPSPIWCRRKIARAYGLLYWAVNLGFAVGSSLGGLLSKHGWYLLFIGDAATTLIYALIVWLRVQETRPHIAAHEERPPPWAALRDRPFLAFVLLVTLVWTVFHQAFITLPVDLRDHGLTPASYGALIALNGVLIVLLQPLVSRALGRVARHRALAMGAALTGAGFGLTGVMRTIPGYALTITVWTLGEIVMAGIAPAATADAAPPHLRGAYQGILSAGMGAASLLAPSLGSLVMGRFGSAALWMACAATCFLSGAGQLALGFRHKPALLSSTAR